MRPNSGALSLQSHLLTMCVAKLECSVLRVGGGEREGEPEGRNNQDSRSLTRPLRRAIKHSLCRGGSLKGRGCGEGEREGEGAPRGSFKLCVCVCYLQVGSGQGTRE